MRARCATARQPWTHVSSSSHSAFTSTHTFFFSRSQIFTIAENKMELTPAIASLVLVVVVLLAMLAAACTVLWRRREASKTRARAWSPPDQLDLEKAPYGDEKDPGRRRRSLKSLFSSQGPAVGRANTRPAASTLNVIASPPLPHLFKLETDGGDYVGVEVRVTPPTPVPSSTFVQMKKPERRLRFEMGPMTQNEADSVWWFL
ncbi:hypothetical protein AcW1_001492 [Taiwanofungus camphoratus]|nr:hypothetical protein AcW1_001492 [Antrodia cinnamomea]